MATHHDTGVSVSPQPPHDGRWATFIPVSYKNMASGDPQLAGTALRSYYLCMAAAGVLAS
jgi:hypothetical protein